MIPFVVKKAAFDVVIVAYNFSVLDPGLNYWGYIMGKDTDTYIEQAAKAGLGVVAMKVMAGGSHHADPKTVPYSGGYLYPKLKQEGAMLAALKWVLKNRSVHTTIPCMTDMAQLDENLKAMAEPFTAADGKQLARRLEYLTPRYCRMCGGCEGSCAQGLPVADILRYLTYAEGYGEFARGREEFQALPSALTQVRCSDCPSCTVTCPFGVQVANRLCRAQELFA
jgi:predicted aldo/keto reductase-like oxidoreductase